MLLSFIAYTTWNNDLDSGRGLDSKGIPNETVQERVHHV